MNNQWVCRECNIINPSLYNFCPYCGTKNDAIDSVSQDTKKSKTHCVNCKIASENLDLIGRMNAVKKDLEEYKYMYEELCK